MAEGFVEAKMLAKKFASLYYLLEDLLSPQKHYDWGLRAIKSVLVVAGSLLRAEAGQVRPPLRAGVTAPPAACLRHACTHARLLTGGPLGLASRRWRRTCCSARCATSTSPRSWPRTWSSSWAYSTISSRVSTPRPQAAAHAPSPSGRRARPRAAPPARPHDRALRLTEPTCVRTALQVPTRHASATWSSRRSSWPPRRRWASRPRTTSCCAWCSSASCWPSGTASSSWAPPARAAPSATACWPRPSPRAATRP
jgi:hypothetical protein